jgi:protein-S-isoprenylcysteine O-methyltransferase Ste14
MLSFTFNFKHSLAFHAGFFLAYSFIRARGVRTGFSPISETKSSKVNRVDKILAVLTVPALLAPLVYSIKNVFIDRNALSSSSESPMWKLFLGALTSTLGLVLLNKSHSDLGKNWSVGLEIKKNHKLVTNGVYSKIGHPMCCSMLLIGTGFCFTLPNTSQSFSTIAVGASYLFSSLLFALHTVPREEKMLVEEFGEEYESYRKNTWRLIPYVF